MEDKVKLAAALHEDWRSARACHNGWCHPRWKEIEDKKYVKRLDKTNLPPNIRLHNNIYEIDIANTSFKNLSPDWKAENIAAAEIILRLLESKKELTIQEMGHLIHEERLKRKASAGNNGLNVPFEELSIIEQVKDIRQYLVGTKMFKNK